AASPPDLFEAITELKKAKNAIILAHYYQDPDIQDAADVVGDSLELARAAQRARASLILFAGVHFMAEGAKILNPEAKVLLPDLRAGCSLSDSCPPEAFRKWKAAHPNAFVVSYINCSAEIKAESDVICTSSNAVRILKRCPPDRPILFGPDRNLGRWVAAQLGRDQVFFWPGSCIVHETFSERRLVELRIRYPDAQLIAHPECEESLLAGAHFVGSTSALLAYAGKSPSRQFIVATEAGILHQMRRKNPDKEFFAAPPNQPGCACNDCPFMKLNTLEKVYQTLRDETPEIRMPDDLRLRALAPLERMMEWSA
ncbi:MAG: quinolinate synthase NadA, partial [Bdellovibrionota bacterium]